MSDAELIATMKAAIETRFLQKGVRTRCPSLKEMAAFLQSKGYETRIEPSVFNGFTGRGKDVHGVELTVIKDGKEVFTHNSANPYRVNANIAEWILSEVCPHPPNPQE